VGGPKLVSKPAAAPNYQQKVIDKIRRMFVRNITKTVSGKFNIWSDKVCIGITYKLCVCKEEALKPKY